MRTVYFILLWLALGDIARLKMKANNSSSRFLCYLFGPIIHITILFWEGAQKYYSEDWTDLPN